MVAEQRRFVARKECHAEVAEYMREVGEHSLGVLVDERNLVDDEIPLQGGSHASSSHKASLEPITKRREDLGKHNVHTHFPKDRKLRDLQADQNYKGSVQKTQRRSRTSC